MVALVKTNAHIDDDGFTRIQVSRYRTQHQALPDCPHPHSDVVSVNKFASISGEEQVEQIEVALGSGGTCVGADGHSVNRDDITID